MENSVNLGSVVARLFGSGQREEVRRLTLHPMLLAVACGVVVLALGLATIDPVFRLLGADESVLHYIHDYMAIYYWGGIFVVAPMIANSVLRASGDAKRPAMIMTTAAVLNIIIDPVLIFGLFGFPRMEIEGAALDGVIANVITMCASFYFVIHREHLVNFRAPAFDQMWDSWRRILHLGVPSDKYSTDWDGEKKRAHYPHMDEEKWHTLYKHACKYMPFFPQLIKLRMKSAEAAALFNKAYFPDGYFDFVYIDGNHTIRYIVEDIYEWNRRVRKGGVISGHDFGRNTKSPYSFQALHVVPAVRLMVGILGVADWYLLGNYRPPAGEKRDKWRSWMWIKN